MEECGGLDKKLGNSERCLLAVRHRTVPVYTWYIQYRAVVNCNKRVPRSIPTVKSTRTHPSRSTRAPHGLRGRRTAPPAPRADCSHQGGHAHDYTRRRKHRPRSHWRVGGANCCAASAGPRLRADHEWCDKHRAASYAPYDGIVSLHPRIGRRRRAQCAAGPSRGCGSIAADESVRCASRWQPLRAAVMQTTWRAFAGTRRFSPSTI